mmetsp:Transcript_20950/g.67698  ORF Transcript_20950/g.67698 Transcript_20950/m.67698 type:complete len:206 (-) Transcript_20950:764-1381(-)
MSRAMSSVAFGRAARSASFCMASRSPARVSQRVSVSAIFLGFLTKAPKPLPSTNLTLPYSWPGRCELRRQGRPRVAASAMVPGPALVTMQSAAAIHSSMFCTKPRIVGFTFGGQSRASRSAFTASFLPQTTTRPASSPASPRSSPQAIATLAMPPTPSPPPTTSGRWTASSRSPWTSPSARARPSSPSARRTASTRRRRPAARAP